MEIYDYFKCPVYVESLKDFLDLTRSISREYEISLEDNVFQSKNIAFDSRVKPLMDYIAQCAWNALDAQGYDMNLFETRLNDLWLQVYNKYNHMPQHVHSNYSHMSGFYFLDVPENSGRIILFDPRPGKNQINLPEKNRNEATYASGMINFEPYEGMLFMTNSWVPHGIDNHISDNSLRVLHFNITVKDYIPTPPAAEVI